MENKELKPYRRKDAVAYAHKWAYGRNPEFFDYDTIGGDCTNYASQCIFAGTGRMNYTPTFGWYYISADQKAPAWTGVIYLHNFLTREKTSPGPVCQVTQKLELAEPGDIIQLQFKGETFQHSPVVVHADIAGDPSQILLAAHSYDADYRPLDTYEYTNYRVLHILGYYE